MNNKRVGADDAATGAAPLVTSSHPLRKLWKRSRQETLGEFMHWWFGRPPANYSFRRKLAIAVNAAPAGRIWDIVQITFTILGLITYVQSTYSDSGLDALDEVLAFLFLLDLLLRWYIAPSRVSYFVDGPYPIVDVLCIAPTFIQWGLGGDSSAHLTFLRVVRCLRLLRILRTFRSLQQTTTPLQRQALTLALTAFSMMYINSGLLNLVEDMFWGYFSGGMPPEDAAGFSFGNAMWFSLVTLTTIGYGDFIPRTEVGKIIDSCFIVASIIIVPLEISALTDIIALQSKFQRPFRPGMYDIPHLLIVGAVQDSRALSEFLMECYHPDRVSNTLGDQFVPKTVILGPEEPSEEIKSLLLNPFFESHLTYVRGSVANGEDLARAAAEHADACFVLGDGVARDPDVADRTTALRTLHVKNYAPHCALYIQLSKAQSLLSIDHSDEVTGALCIDEWRSHLLAHSALLPGFSTLVWNLVRTVAGPTDAHAAKLSDWALEYAHGASQEVYCVPLPELLDGCSFLSVAALLYDLFKGAVMLVGVREPSAVPHTPAARRRLRRLARRRARGSILSSAVLNAVSEGMKGEPVRGSILLNPGPAYRLCWGQSIYVLAPDARVAVDITDPKSYVQAKENGRLAGLTLQPEGRDPELHGYGYPTDYEAHTWTWGKMARSNARLSSWFADYLPSHCSVHLESDMAAAAAVVAARRGGRVPPDFTSRQPSAAAAAAATPSTSTISGKATTAAGGRSSAAATSAAVQQSGAASSSAPASTQTLPPAAAAPSPVAGEEKAGVFSAPRSVTPARVRAIMLWTRLRRHIRNEMMERKGILTRVDANNTALASSSSSSSLALSAGSTATAVKRRRRLSTANKGVSASMASIPAGRSRKLFNDMMSATDAARERGSVLRQLIVGDVRMSSERVEGHIIVCGALPSFQGLLAPLRSPHMRGSNLFRHVVLLTSFDESEAAQAALEDIVYYGGVTVVIGSLAAANDLLRAGISTASCAIILSSPSAVDGGGDAVGGGGGGGATDNTLLYEAMDGSVIFAYLTLEQTLTAVAIHPAFYVVVELKRAQNMQVLNSKRMSKLRVSVLWKEQLASLQAEKAATSAVSAFPRRDNGAHRGGGSEGTAGGDFTAGDATAIEMSVAAERTVGKNDRGGGRTFGPRNDAASSSFFLGRVRPPPAPTAVPWHPGSTIGHRPITASAGLHEPTIGHAASFVRPHASLPEAFVRGHDETLSGAAAPVGAAAGAAVSAADRRASRSAGAAGDQSADRRASRAAAETAGDPSAAAVTAATAVVSAPSRAGVSVSEPPSSVDVTRSSVSTTPHVAASAGPLRASSTRPHSTSPTVTSTSTATSSSSTSRGRPIPLPWSVLSSGPTTSASALQGRTSTSHASSSEGVAAASTSTPGERPPIVIHRSVAALRAHASASSTTSDSRASNGRGSGASTTSSGETMGGNRSTASVSLGALLHTTGDTLSYSSSTPDSSAPATGSSRLVPLSEHALPLSAADANADMAAAATQQQLEQQQNRRSSRSWDPIPLVRSLLIPNDDNDDIDAVADANEEAAEANDLEAVQELITASEPGSTSTFDARESVIRDGVSARLITASEPGSTSTFDNVSASTVRETPGARGALRVLRAGAVLATVSPPTASSADAQLLHADPTEVEVRPPSPVEAPVAKGAAATENGAAVTSSLRVRVARLAGAAPFSPSASHFRSSEASPSSSTLSPVAPASPGLGLGPISAPASPGLGLAAVVPSVAGGDAEADRLRRPMSMRTGIYDGVGQHRGQPKWRPEIVEVDVALPSHESDAGDVHAAAVVPAVAASSSSTPHPATAAATTTAAAAVPAPSDSLYHRSRELQQPQQQFVVSAAHQAAGLGEPPQQPSWGSTAADSLSSARRSVTNKGDFGSTIRKRMESHRQNKSTMGTDSLAPDFTYAGGPFSLPFFAAGYAVATDSLNPILLQSYFDAEVVRFAEELLTPSPDRSSRLITEPVPRRFHGATFEVLFKAMMSSYGVVVMGLYRSRRACDSPLSYVYTSPDPATVLYSNEDDEDVMYVLSPRPLFTGSEALAPHEVVNIEQLKPHLPTRDVAKELKIARLSNARSGGFAHLRVGSTSVGGGVGNNSTGTGTPGRTPVATVNAPLQQPLQSVLEESIHGSNSSSNSSNNSSYVGVPTGEGLHLRSSARPASVKRSTAPVSPFVTRPVSMRGDALKY